MLQGDKEHTLRDTMRKITAIRTAHTVLRYRPKASKGSQGLVESIHTQIQCLVRCHMLQIKTDTGVTINTTSLLFDTAVSHAAFVIARGQMARALPKTDQCEV